MSQELDAIFEGGVFRPLSPLNLPESAKVTIRVQESGDPPISSADLQHQQQALNAMFAVGDSLPQVSHNDGLSGRDHDQILYGSPN